MSDQVQRQKKQSFNVSMHFGRMKRDVALKKVVIEEK